jgi:hypothetical protein
MKPTLCSTVLTFKHKGQFQMAITFYIYILFVIIYISHIMFYRVKLAMNNSDVKLMH